MAEIERWRRQRLSGPAIARQLAMPVSTVGSVLRRLGLGKLAALEPRPPVVRYQRERPGELIHIDTKKLGRIEAVGHRITGAALRAAHRGRPWEPAARRNTSRGAGWEAVHVCIDDASRLAYSEVLPDERKTSAVPFLERAVAWFARQGARRSGPTSVVGPGSQARVERVMTDNGSADRSHHWRHACGGLELRHLRTRGAPGRPPRAALGASRAYTPRINGKAERFIQTSLHEWAYARPFASSHERTATLISWVDHYNTARPHTALAHQPPFTRLCQSAFLGSIDGAVPPSRPAISDDRPAGAVPGAPQATGASRRAACRRRTGHLEPEEAQCSVT